MPSTPAGWDTDPLDKTLSPDLAPTRTSEDTLKDQTQTSGQRPDMSIEKRSTCNNEGNQTNAATPTPLQSILSSHLKRYARNKQLIFCHTTDTHISKKEQSNNRKLQEQRKQTNNR